MVPRKCKLCGKKFLIKRSHVLYGWGIYCSMKCLHQSARTGRWLKCHCCGKDVYRTPKYINASKSKKYFCNKSCQTLWRNQEFSGQRHNNWKNGEASYRNIMKRAEIEAVCKFCGTKDDRVIVVHHKDKNRQNNVLENLVWLCRNCHYLVHNYPVGRERGLIV